MDSWIETLRSQARELERYATWASIVQLGAVRDHIRRAIYDINQEAERLESMKGGSSDGKHPQGVEAKTSE